MCFAVTFMYRVFDQNMMCSIVLVTYFGGTIPGPQFNIKMSSYQYRKSHCGDKTIWQPSYLHNGISYTGKTASLYWIRAQNIQSDFLVWHFVARLHLFDVVPYDLLLWKLLTLWQVYNLVLFTGCTRRKYYLYTWLRNPSQPTSQNIDANCWQCGWSC